jgi:hypothetical protein
MLDVLNAVLHHVPPHVLPAGTAARAARHPTGPHTSQSVSRWQQQQQRQIVVRQQGQRQQQQQQWGATIPADSAALGECVSGLATLQSLQALLGHVTVITVAAKAAVWASDNSTLFCFVSLVCVVSYTASAGQLVARSPTDPLHQPVRCQ